MLVLSRKLGEAVVISECGMTVTVVAVQCSDGRLGVNSSTDIDLDRKEIWQRVSQEDDWPGVKD